MQKNNDIFDPSKTKTSSLSDKFKSLDEPIAEPKKQLPPNMVACRSCGAPISRNAKVCQICHEYQNEDDKRKAQADIERYNYNSVEFSSMEWTIILICPIIGLIQSVMIYFSGNTTKGSKYFMYSLIATLFYIMLKYALDMLMAAH